MFVAPPLGNNWSKRSPTLKPSTTSLLLISSGLTSLGESRSSPSSWFRLDSGLCGGNANLRCKKQFKQEINKKHMLEQKLLFSELRRCVKVEVAVFDSPSVIVLMVSMDVKQTLSSTRTRTRKLQIIWREGKAEQEHSLSTAKLSRNECDHRARAEELCGSRGGRPGEVLLNVLRCHLTY